MARSFGKGRFMPDGSIVYPKKGWEPPPDIEGYRRDPGNAWVFLPLWPACADRTRTAYMKKCGAYCVIMTCESQECPAKGQQVTFNQCRDCPFRREA